jgi:hypothetical protein
MTARSILTPIALALAGFAVMWAFLSYRYAAAEDVPQPGPAVAALFDAGPEAPVAPQLPPVLLAPESDPEAFVNVMRDMAKTSWPGFAVFAALAIVSLVRRKLKKAREGTTGIATATAFAFLAVVAASIAMGVPIGQALGGGLVALLTGRAFATQLEPAKG